MYYFEICDINFVFKKTTCSFLISNAFFEISCGCEGSENKRKPPKHGYQRVIFCWFTNISQPFMHLQYTGKQSPPFYLIHFMIYFFFFFWVNIKCTFYFHFRQTFSDFKFSESYKCRCCFFFIHTCFHSVALKTVLRDWIWYTTIMTATCRRFCTRLFGIFLCTLFISILTPWGISVYINIKFWGFSDVCFLMLLKIDRFIYHYLL